VRTYSPKPADVTREWHVIDATDVTLGRLAVQIATLLRGKHKPTFAPHVDGGDFVVVINASKVALSGTKRTDKLAYRHSGHPGGLTATPIGEILDKEEPPEPEAADQAEGVRRSGAPAQRPAAEAVRDHPDRPVSDRRAR
jgi:large subunit ribosomal protein L13